MDLQVQLCYSHAAIQPRDHCCSKVSCVLTISWLDLARENDINFYVVHSASGLTIQLAGDGGSWLLESSCQCNLPVVLESLSKLISV